MGVIQRQGTKQGLVNYIGVIIGFASTLWIYPRAYDAYGMAGFMMDLATLLVSFSILGINHLPIRFFPIFKNDNNRHNGFFPLLVISALIAFSLFALVLFIFKGPMTVALDYLMEDPSDFWKNKTTILSLCLLISLIGISTNYISNFHRIVVPSLLNNITLKIALPILVLLVFWGAFNIEEFKLGLVLVYCAILLSLLVYIIQLKQFTLKINVPFLKRDLVKKMSVYALFGIFGSFGALLATRIDVVMVTSLLPGFTSTGVYKNSMNIANVIGVPYLAFIGIASPIIAVASKENDYKKILNVYQRSSLGLFVVGLGLFLCVWVSVGELFGLMPNSGVDASDGKFIVLFLGIAKVIDMVTGINHQIIAYSKYYKFNVVTVIILGVTNVITNSILIPKFGIIGAALATLISLALFNLIKFCFVWIVFKIQPFTWATIKVLGIGGLALGVGSLIPDTPWILINIALQSGILALVFGGIILYFKIAPDINNFVEMIWRRVLNWTKDSH